MLTLEQAKARLKINSTNQDVELQLLLDGITEYLISTTGVVSTNTLTISKPAGESLKVLVTDAFDSLSINKINFNNGSFEKVPADLSSLKATTQSITFPLEYEEGEYEVVLNISVDSGIQKQLDLATLYLLEYYYKKEFVQSASNGGQTYTFNPSYGTLPKQVRAIIDAIRVI